MPHLQRGGARRNQHLREGERYGPGDQGQFEFHGVPSLEKGIVAEKRLASLAGR